ncbi:suppressor of cytokine signaling 7-like [Cervus canadensis]|uniref:suppressor of cytokine signaling 7-like n=1 Tax=Cervus canadensis TaxID=1574408 RepID=UPI001CA33D33|nr:suppressor of cytokine signaling 7-like [Cervus canadensis]
MSHPARNGLRFTCPAPPLPPAALALGLRPRLTAADCCPLGCPWSPRAPSPPPSKFSPQEGSQWKAPASAQTFLVFSGKEEGSVQFPERQPNGMVNHGLEGDVSIRPLVPWEPRVPGPCQRAASHGIWLARHRDCDRRSPSLAGALL